MKDLLLGIFLIVFGLIMILNPSIIWVISESWKSSTYSEPSNLYIFSTRFGGIMMTLAGIGSMVVYFLSKK
ncbi:hypothetical protein GCM10008967_37800 [Bacillus carboniphilus]|uniref:DUF6199 domain-containing protein n=1 Tax=Bacillus carboniphilus TaxID=86663 RepID=A0ABN0WPZ4_9BACI